MRPAAGDLPLARAAERRRSGRGRRALRVPRHPGYVAEHALAFVEEGAAVVGGCCGTGPEHTSAIAAALSSGRHAGVQVAERAETPADSTEPDVPGDRVDGARRPRSRPGRSSIAVEMEPPRSTSAARLVAAAGPCATPAPT